MFIKFLLKLSLLVKTISSPFYLINFINDNHFQAIVDIVWFDSSVHKFWCIHKNVNIYFNQLICLLPTWFWLISKTCHSAQKSSPLKTSAQKPHSPLHFPLCKSCHNETRWIWAYAWLQGKSNISGLDPVFFWQFIASSSSHRPFSRWLHKKWMAAENSTLVSGWK